MANYNTLKDAIQDVIKTNGNREITGALLQQSLLAMINSLGADYQFRGVAILSTNPGTPDQNVAYIAADAGTYSNFPDANNHPLVVNPGELCVFLWNGYWFKQSMGVGGGGGGQAPMIVVGRASNILQAQQVRGFYPTDGTTFEQAKSAFLSGRQVFIKGVGSGTDPDNCAIIIGVYNTNEIPSLIRLVFQTIEINDPVLGYVNVANWYKNSHAYGNDD